MTNHRQLVLERQEPLREHYRTSPHDAWIRDGARTIPDAKLDPFHTLVLAGQGEEGPWRVGIHKAVGGFHDLPNPGDILCAALAGCLETTTRILAARLGVPIRDIEVRVTGEVDVRGTLGVDRETPVGFQRMACSLRGRLEEGATSEQAGRLAAAAERACVVLQTLRHGVPVSLTVDNVSNSSGTLPSPYR
jgi:uncharacterized OsmC-like protein